MWGRVWDPKHVGGSGYPEGQIEFHINAEDAPNLRDWVASHTGTGPDPNHQHYWDSASNLVGVSVAGMQGVAFDAVQTGPEAPPSFHEVVFVMGPHQLFITDWWSYSDTYRPTISQAGQSLLDSIATQPSV